MKKRNGFTKSDLLVGISCVLFLLLTIQVLGAGGRGRAKQAVCLANLRQLTAAWEMYADDNNDVLVNGSAGFVKNYPSGSSSGTRNWQPWVGRFFDLSTMAMRCDLAAQDAMLKGPEDITQVGTSLYRGTNLLYRYIQDTRVFKCPDGERCHAISYGIVDAMAGAATYSGTTSSMGAAIKHKSEIARPSQRFVFVDDGRVPMDSWTLYYDRPSWWDAVPARHGMGGTFSFADGHSEYHQWIDQRTMELIQQQPGISGIQPCNPDLEWVQIHAWGKLGYDRSAYGCE